MMDPDASFRDLLDAVEAGAADRVAELAYALAGWMSRGGFPPRTFGPETLGTVWHDAVTRAVIRLAKTHVPDRHGAERKGVMFHPRRVWCVSPVETFEELARKLAETTWCCCTAFSLGGCLWLNDSPSPDGAQEYAVLKRERGSGSPLQIASIAFGWCDEAQALHSILETLAGRYDLNDFRRSATPVLQTPERHGRCRHCA